ncbi:hypothetical protein BH09PSE6_BH09PSE6_03650 [soil metagenome]
MNRSRRRLVAALTSTLVLNACVTRQLWRDVSYSELVQAVRMTPDASQLAVFGLRYSYLFAMPTGAAAFVRGDLPAQVTASTGTFTLGTNGALAGELHLELSAAASAAHKREARSLGFVDDVRDGRKVLVCSERLTGWRYQAIPLDDLDRPMLERTIGVHVVEASSMLQTAGRVAATPFTAVVDLAGLVVLPFIAFANGYQSR